MNTDLRSLIDLSYLDMMADGDDFMKKTMVDMLIEELPPEVEKLREAFLTSDAEQLRQVAHKMKSTLAFIGHPKMTEANATLEEIGKQNTELQRASVHVQVMEDSSPAVIEALKAESQRLAQ